MREELRDPLRLHHIAEAIRRIDGFMTGKGEEELQGDSLLYYAVVKNIEIVGEAAYMLTNEFKVAHPETPWR